MHHGYILRFLLFTREWVQRQEQTLAIEPPLRRLAATLRRATSGQFAGSDSEAAMTYDPNERENTAENSVFKKSQLQVLVADDEPSVREIMGIMLNHQGHHVEFAENGREALRLVGKNDFDLIISDQNMPLLNGTQLADAIEPRGIPFILITGLESGVGENRPGITKVLSKPISLECLEAAISKALKAA